MFGDRVLERDGNDESCLDIARRLKRWPIVEFLTQKYPQLEGKVGMGEGAHTVRDRYPWTTVYIEWESPFCLTGWC